MTEQPEFIRAFVALKLPPAAKEALHQAQSRLARAVPGKGVRWVRPEQIHLTLQFLGNVKGVEVSSLSDALHLACVDQGRFLLRLGGLGGFPSCARPRVLWVGLEGDFAHLRRLQSAVAAACRGFGEPEPAREFQPHLTLGRVLAHDQQPGRAAGAALAEAPSPPPCEWSATHVHLIRSQLAPSGATYTDLAEFPLQG